MKNILIASDAFKGSATSAQIADYLAKGILSVLPSAKIQKVPVADGGEGTVECLTQALNGIIMTTRVQGPLKDTVTAKWGLLNKDTAVIEMAAAAGLTLEPNLNVAAASTYGVGQLIQAAMAKDVQTIYVGLGGSATNDGGTGMARALGVKFYDDNGQLQPGVENLRQLKHVDISGLDARLKQTKIIGLLDVDNPLIGINGASYVFGPQKGATSQEVKLLDEALAHLTQVIKTNLKVDYSREPGAGAAGGLGYGLMTYCHAEIKVGIDEIVNLIKLDKKMSEASLVITGEGHFDGQSLRGKVPIGVARLAKDHDLPVIAVVGGIGKNVGGAYDQGFEAWQTFGYWLTNHAADLGEDIQAHFDYAAHVKNDGQLEAAYQLKADFTNYLNYLLGDDGALLLPMTSSTAPEKSADLETVEQIRQKTQYLTCLAGLAGMPQVALPIHSAGDLSLALIANRHQDAALLDFAQKFDAEL